MISRLNNLLDRPDDNACNPVRIEQLLDDALPPAEQVALAEHLSTCAKCQQRIDGLTAQSQWFAETQETLATWTDTELSNSCHASDSWISSESSSLVAVSNGHQTEELSGVGDPSDHWVLQLIDPPAEKGGLGTVDGMRVESIVGQGGMGVVLQVHDETLNRQLAVKLLSPMLANSGASRQRFLREAKAAASVVHPNIVPIYAVHSDRKLPCLVMPFVGGGNLQQVVDRDGPLPLERVLSVGLQVAEALAEAHTQGIVHRDIKPANLMLDEGGFRVLLTDFGLARALDDATLTASGMIAGTPQFMSPEQARGGSVDHRSDLYSLGAVLYTLATGYPPAKGDSALQVLRKIAEAEIRPATELNEQLPAWFERLLETLMAKSPEDRVESGHEAADILRSALAHQRSPHQVPLPENLRSSSSRTRRWIMSIAILGGKVAMLVGVAVMVAVGILGFWPEDNGTQMSNYSVSRPDRSTQDAGLPPPQSIRSASAEREFAPSWEQPRSGSIGNNRSFPPSTLGLAAAGMRSAQPSENAASRNYNPDVDPTEELPKQDDLSDPVNREWTGADVDESIRELQTQVLELQQQLGFELGGDWESPPTQK
ncbi:MAG: protein kinase domain-containing protein [Aureliella sp.]